MNFDPIAEIAARSGITGSDKDPATRGTPRSRPGPDRGAAENGTVAGALASATQAQMRLLLPMAGGAAEAELSVQTDQRGPAGERMRRLVLVARSAALGELRFGILVRQGMVEAEIEASRKDVLALAREHVPVLVRGLVSLGYRPGPFNCHRCGTAGPGSVVDQRA